MRERIQGKEMKTTSLPSCQRGGLFLLKQDRDCWTLFLPMIHPVSYFFVCFIVWIFLFLGLRQIQKENLHDHESFPMHVLLSLKKQQ